MYQNATKIYDIANFDEQFSYVYGKKNCAIQMYLDIDFKINQTKLHCTIYKKKYHDYIKFFSN